MAVDRRLGAGLAILAFSFAFPYLYDRYQGFKLILDNAPEKLPNISAFASAEIKFRDEVKNCEDAVMDESRGIAFLSCDSSRDHWDVIMGTSIDPAESGAIYKFDYASTPNTLVRLSLSNFPRPADFHPLGISYHSQSNTLFVVNHRSSGPAIELFSYADHDSTALYHIRTLTHPLIHAPNAVTALSATSLLITNDHFFSIRKWPLLSRLEAYLAVPIGSIEHVDFSAPGEVHATQLARLPLPNGIAMVNQTTLTVASTSRPGVYFYDIHRPTDSGNIKLELRRVIKTRFAPDNLRVDSRGRLLVAGHPHPVRGEGDAVE
ncbi:hypothetical protein H2199_008858 [Coniosporium tulheliwenetii]|uniref:Uncharacterized protein n=1 Tax=Coniosporium tulheliwenetii TaxID=3383036 RepID=A0ACC2YGX8_9PEZI|nr:hypothetical protein H2199_008858 [Cladosporium sp. JES 115]